MLLRKTSKWCSFQSWAYGDGQIKREGESIMHQTTEIWDEMVISQWNSSEKVMNCTA